jgi:D-glycero-alpha-D-manno-heptose-7-phosphate kinase
VLNQGAYLIISRTPLRISFAGGGSDLPEFYREYGGAVISTSIKKYVYVTVNPKFDDGIRVAYSKTEEVDSVSKIEHRLVRAVLNHVGIDGGVEITTVADIPSRGTGLGSSSAFAVALLHALHAHKGRHVGKVRLSEESCQIEIEVCGEPIGKQDQYAAAFGGLNLIEFHTDDTVVVSPVICEQRTVKALRENLLLLYTGITRSASRILRYQTEAIRESAEARSGLKRMVQLCYYLREEIQQNNLNAFGEILHENWELKKTLAEQISTSAIDECYTIARRHGALGGKILGAGAGGFLLLYADVTRHEAIKRALLPMLRAIPFDFDRQGSQIIFYQPSEEETETLTEQPAVEQAQSARGRSKAKSSGA